MPAEIEGAYKSARNGSIDRFTLVVREMLRLPPRELMSLRSSCVAAFAHHVATDLPRLSAPSEPSQRRVCSAAYDHRGLVLDRRLLANLERIYQKLGVETRTAAVTTAMQAARTRL